MCGIIGYAGKKSAAELLVSGLERMEYRGYDSAGVSLCPLEGGKPEVLRAVGRVSELKKKLEGFNQQSQHGIGHTRWATHGVPSETNAHPHQAGLISLVHNGIIENYAELREELRGKGLEFSSQTDTEVFTNLLNLELQSVLGARSIGDFSDDEQSSMVFSALCASRSRVQGHYAVLFTVEGMPGSLFGLHQGAPMVFAFDEENAYAASDLQALIEHRREIAFLAPGQSLHLKAGRALCYSCDQKSFVEPDFETIEWSPDKVDRDGYEHFMLKEVFQQPMTVAETLSGRLPQDDFSPFIWDRPEEHVELWRKAKKLYLVACGTAYHAAQVAKYYFEQMAQISVDVDLASEFRYRMPVLEEDSIVGVISQSGETADTLAALRLAKDRGRTTFSVCNVPGSTIMRESDFQYSTRAGPEIGVASTKAFTNQLTILCALSADVARLRDSKVELRDGVASALARLPHDLEQILQDADRYRQIGASLEGQRTILFVGRGTMYPIALEGALKLKEITYRHAEGYAAGELKHGPIAMVDSKLTSVVLGPPDAVLPKTLSNLEEIRSRNGKIVGIGQKANSEFESLCDSYIPLPELHWSVAPMAYVLPLQLISYGLARHLGCDIDKPRNLAKSVTVE